MCQNNQASSNKLRKKYDSKLSQMTITFAIKIPHPSKTENNRKLTEMLDI